MFKVNNGNTRKSYEICSKLTIKTRSSLIYSTSARHERHECETSATRVLHYFDNDTSKNIFSHNYIYYTASERLKGEKQFHFKNYFLEVSFFHAKMRLESAPQKVNFLTEKATSKSYTLDCRCKYPCTFPHSHAASFLMKTILCENTNILFSKNYWKRDKMNARFWKNI